MDRIKNWFRSLGNKAHTFMYGRYGYDELSQFLSMTALICVIISLFIWPSFFCSLALVMYLLSLYRMYSRNVAKRRKERDVYLQRTQPVRRWVGVKRRMFVERKTHRYFRCAQCKVSLRVPKEKGRLRFVVPNVVL